MVLILDKIKCLLIELKNNNNQASQSFGTGKFIKSNLMVLKILLIIVVLFILIGNYTLVITNEKTHIRTTRRFNGLVWVWLLREKMFWKKVEDLKPNSRNNITETI